MNRTILPILRPLVYLTLLASLFTGCSEQSRYRVLTFFFTGVPPLEESVEAKEELPDLQQSGRVLTETSSQLYSHPLWASGICDPCHQTTSTFTVPGVSSRGSSHFKSGGGMPGKLVRPQNMLCLKCHTDKSPLRALGDNLWLHNTTARGNCLECHSPHQSEYPHVLKKRAEAICYPCHEKGEYLNSPAHRQQKPCLDCHNPHMGKNRSLLTYEYQEMKLPVNEVPGHPEFSSKPAEVRGREDTGVRQQ